MDSDKKRLAVGARLVALIEGWPDDVSSVDVEHPSKPEPMTPEEEQQMREAFAQLTPGKRTRALLAAVILSDDERGETYQQVHAAMLQGNFAEVNNIIDGLFPAQA